MTDGAILGPKIVRALDKQLLSYFDFKENNPCKNLKAAVSQFMNSICEDFDTELIKTSVEYNKKSFDDWKSWYISELLDTQRSAIVAFAHTVIDIESLQISASNRVPCEAGYSHFNEFAGCWRRACQERQLYLEVQPKSKKFQDKRKNHDWAPYLSDIFKKKA